MDLNHIECAYGEDSKTILKRLSILIKELFDKDIPVFECGFEYYCSMARIDEKEIRIMFGKDSEEYKEFYSESFRKNMDTKVAIENYDNCPKFLFIFFHELSHMLTVNMKIDQYAIIYNKWRTEYQESIDPQLLHRLFPYEKLADNLSVKLITENKKEIMNILSGEPYCISDKQKRKNLKLIRRYEEKYIKSMVAP